MRTPRTPALVAAGIAVAAAVTVTVVLALGTDEPEPVAAGPTSSPTATEPTAAPTTPEPTEEEPTEEPPPPAEPFDVRLVESDVLHVVTTDNAPILSRDSLPTDERVAADAAEIARTSFEEFLDAQFTDPATWFGDEAIDALLAPQARETLDGEARAALGRLDLDVDHVVTGAAEIDPMVTMHGDSPRNVAADIAANLTVVATDGAETRLRLRGAMVFVPTEDGWLVGAVDATLEEADA